MKKILSLALSLKLKNIILFLNWGLIFFQMVIFAIVRTLSNVVQFNVEIHNIVLTSLNVVKYNVYVHNVVSTLIWRCATSRHHIKLKTTLNRCWNVCWDRFEGLLHVGILIRTRIIDFTMEWHVISLNEAPLKSIKSYF